MLSLFPSQQNKIPAISLFIVHAIFFASILFTYLHSNAELEKQVKTQQIIASTTTLSKLYYDAGLAIGAYSLTKNEMFSERAQKLIEQIPVALKNLETQTEEQPVKEIKFTDIKSAAQQGLNELEIAKKAISNSPSSLLSSEQIEIRGAYKKIKTISDELQTKLDKLSEGEQKLSRNCPEHIRLFQLLLITTFIFYVSFNYTIQRKLTDLVCRLAHNT